MILRICITISGMTIFCLKILQIMPSPQWRTDIDNLYVVWCVSEQGCAFSWFHWYCFPFRGHLHQSTPIWIVVLKPYVQNIKTFIKTTSAISVIFCTSIVRPSSTYCVWSQNASNKSKMKDCCHLETDDKLLHLNNYFDQFQ